MYRVSLKDSKKLLQRLWIGVFLFIVLTFLIRIVTYFINLNYSVIILCNHGISFGITIPIYLFWIVWVCIISLLIFFFINSFKRPLLFSVSYILIIVGGVNNVIDRLIYGCVIDYIRIVPWNVFNLSDIFIFIGAIIILYLYFFEKQ